MKKYELAKKLKDNGYPQRGMGKYILFEENTEWSVNKEHPRGAYNPTLEELIEACGDTVFFDLIKCKDGWLATDHYMRGEGSTPIEAVANLWLKLYEKK